MAALRRRGFDGGDGLGVLALGAGRRSTEYRNARVRWLCHGDTWTLYLFGVPVAGFAALITGFRDAKRRRLPRQLAAVIGVVVAVTLVFWWWSITRAGG
jgi:hypothetical protein